MKLHRIINSLLETDMYKFSMGQAIFHQFTDYRTNWTFRCRNKDVKFTAEMVEEIKEQIKAYCELRFTDEVKIETEIRRCRSDQRINILLAGKTNIPQAHITFRQSVGYGFRRRENQHRRHHHRLHAVAKYRMF